MNELLRELVRQRLSAAKDCPAKADIVEEITADLTEKYNELTAGGMEPEARIHSSSWCVNSLIW